MTTITTTPVTASARTELPAPHADTLVALHDREHPACFACGQSSDGGLGLVFTVSPDTQTVTAEWCAPAWAISYAGTVHGGLIATVLDSAMVHALFARGCEARTASLTIRYRHPVRTASVCAVNARLLHTRAPLFQLEATLHQDGHLCASASAIFMRSPATHPTSDPRS